MEDILSILVIIFIAIASVNKKNKKKKAKAPDSKGPVHFSSASEKSLREMKEFIRDVGKTVLEMDDDEEIDAPAKMKAKKMKAKSAKAAGPAKIATAPSKPAAAQTGSLRGASVIEEGMGTAPVSTQGRSLFEDKGCIGGSIAHDSHEGDSRYPDALGEAERYDESSVYAGDIAQELQTMNLERLRRAVVISEILDRPKALRRR